MQARKHRNGHSRSTIQFVYQEMLSPHMILVMLTTGVVIVGVYCLIGPIGTYKAISPLHRWGISALYFVAGWPIWYSLNVVALYFVRFRSPLEAVLTLALAALFGAFACTTIMYTVETLAHLHDFGGAELLRLGLVVAMVGIGSSVLFLYVACQRLKHARGHVEGATAGEVRREHGISDTVSEPPPGQSNGVPSVPGAESSANGQHQQQPQQALDADSGDGTLQAPFLELLPHTLGRDLIYLKSEDHYVAAFTTMGSNLVKMRFADAVAEIGEERGTQVHRCFWVAYRHMEELVKRERKYVLRLTDNYEVPVSATYRGAVRTAMRQDTQSSAREA